MYCDLLFTDGGLEMVSEAQPRSAVGCSVLFYDLVQWMVSNWMEGYTSRRILIFYSFAARMFYDSSLRFRHRRRGSLDTWET
ncbi:hypothetical protein [Rubritalea tangerina]|uniref:hypothetical protein n=1 Tax=Rubritalea tangerina TaxID=430798 RepID=UPI00361BF49F